MMICTVRFRVLLLCFLFLRSLSAQVTTPTVEQDHKLAAQNPEFRLSVTANTVLVDVVVTDRDGLPIRNLRREDFQVVEDGVSQKITSFETPVERSRETVIPLLPLGKDVYSNFIDIPATTSVDILLLDALNTQVADQKYLRNRLLGYLQKMKSGHPLAVFLLSSKLSLLQPLTTDPAPLIAALNSHAADPKQTAFLAAEDDILQAERNLDYYRPRVKQIMKEFQLDMRAFRLKQRLPITLNAFQQLNRYLANIPGRKNILWFSAAFPLYLLPDMRLRDPFRNIADYTPELHQLADSLATNRVAVYPVDIRGVLQIPIYDSSFSSMSVQRANEITSQFLDHSVGEMDTTDLLAKETGGRAIRNTNDLQQAIDHILETDSIYYSLSYTPTRKKQDGKFHRIGIKLDDKLHYSLSFRRGYYATDLHAKHDLGEEEQKKLFASSMGYEVPQATEIIFKAHITTGDASNHGAGKNLAATPPQKSERSSTHCQIDLVASLTSVSFTPVANEVTHGELIVGAIAYGPNGEILDSNTKQVSIEATRGEYSRLMQYGFPYHLDLTLPLGSSWIRIGVYDPVSEHLGTLEIPSAQVGVLN